MLLRFHGRCRRYCEVLDIHHRFENESASFTWPAWRLISKRRHLNDISFLCWRATDVHWPQESLSFYRDMHLNQRAKVSLFKPIFNPNANEAENCFIRKLRDISRIQLFNVSSVSCNDCLHPLREALTRSPWKSAIHSCECCFKSSVSKCDVRVPLLVSNPFDHAPNITVQGNQVRVIRARTPYTRTCPRCRTASPELNVPWEPVHCPTGRRIASLRLHPHPWYYCTTQNSLVNFFGDSLLFHKERWRHDITLAFFRGVSARGLVNLPQTLQKPCTWPQHCKKLISATRKIEWFQLKNTQRKYFRESRLCGCTPHLSRPIWGNDCLVYASDFSRRRPRSLVKLPTVCREIGI